MARQLGNFVQDLRLSRDFHSELRFRRLYRKYGGDGVFAVLLLWNWVAGNCPTTGRLEKMTREDILDVGCVAPEHSKFIDDLVDFEFLALDDDGTFFLPNWAEEQPHAAKAQERSEEARRKAEKSWENRRKRKSKDDAAKEQCNGSAAAKPKQCSNTNTNAFKSPLTPPLGGEEKTERIVELYREMLPELPQPKEVTAKLRRDIERAREASPERGELSWWRERFEQVRQSPHLMGESGNWRASLGWLVTGGNLDKLLAGHYPPRVAAAAFAPASMTDEEFERMREAQLAESG